ncbi:AraC family transcriptional regulator [Treponema pectinovorum]|uniref:AraC family transcriptional regulator n=1 Tax=Treponema pectinovorum TaxID=164 RepID=UPI0011F22A94|nr:AraC family transcriptional regulator [Treponema pectinovorum]
MEQTVYDSRRNALYRDRIKDFFIDCKIQAKSMADSHYHPYYEFFYVVKGSCRIFAEHNLFSVNAGELVIIPPSTLHRSQYDGEHPVERITLSFTADYINSFAQILNFNLLDELFVGKMSFSGKSRGDFLSALQELLHESKNNDSFSEANTKALLTKIFILVKRNSLNLKKDEIIGTENHTEQSIQKAAKYIFENYSDEITLKTASRVAGMSDTYFSKKFMEITGFGFKEYLTNIRIKHSEEMLSFGKLTITQIAGACGFTDANYFGDAFKKRNGCSPRNFRKKIATLN